MASCSCAASLAGSAGACASSASGATMLVCGSCARAAAPSTLLRTRAVALRVASLPADSSAVACRCAPNGASASAKAGTAADCGALVSWKVGRGVSDTSVSAISAPACRGCDCVDCEGCDGSNMRAWVPATLTIKLPSGRRASTAADIDLPTRPARARWKSCWRASSTVSAPPAAATRPTGATLILSAPGIMPLPLPLPLLLLNWRRGRRQCRGPRWRAWRPGAPRRRTRPTACAWRRCC